MHRSMVSDIIIDCNDLEKGVAFWTQALGFQVTDRWESYVFLGRLGQNGPRVGLQAVPEAKTAKSRVHLDIMTDNIEAEAQRLEKLGAHQQPNQPSPQWLVMLDPCGNEFCVIGVLASRPDFAEFAKEWKD